MTATLHLPTSRTHAELTHRELEVLYLLCLWKRPEQVEAKLRISRDTMKAHSRHIREKLGVERTIDAVLFTLKRRKLRRLCDEAYG
jgi:ATP/maltotriose-dependent transcriptional regulator MalT